MTALTHTVFSQPSFGKAFDWTIFYGGMASLVFAVSMTVIGASDTRNADAALDVEVVASL